MKKSDVNGDNANEVYNYLKAQKAGILGLTRIKVSCCLIACGWDVLMSAFVQWNFEKFLVDKQGNVVNRWASTTAPEALEGEIEKLL